jgi:hypothetical protein
MCTSRLLALKGGGGDHQADRCWICRRIVAFSER